MELNVAPSACMTFYTQRDAGKRMGYKCDQNQIDGDQRTAAMDQQVLLVHRQIRDAQDTLVPMKTFTGHPWRERKFPAQVRYEFLTKPRDSVPIRVPYVRKGGSLRLSNPSGMCLPLTFACSLLKRLLRNLNKQLLQHESHLDQLRLSTESDRCIRYRPLLAENETPNVAETMMNPYNIHHTL